MAARPPATVREVIGERAPLVDAGPAQRPGDRHACTPRSCPLGRGTSRASPTTGRGSPSTRCFEQLAADLLGDPGAGGSGREALKNRLLDYPAVAHLGRLACGRRCAARWSTLARRPRRARVRRRLADGGRARSPSAWPTDADLPATPRRTGWPTPWSSWSSRYGSEVTAVITHTIERWDGRRGRPTRIELHVGRDLQFIRINGTLVGGLVGVADPHGGGPDELNRWAR